MMEAEKKIELDLSNMEFVDIVDSKSGYILYACKTLAQPPSIIISLSTKQARELWCSMRTFEPELTQIKEMK